MRLTSVTFTSSTTWKVPAGVRSVIVLGQGGGGGGGAGALNSGASARYGGQGGVATFLSPRIVSVTPGATLNITIGAGGTGAPPGDMCGAEGGVSIFGTANEFIGGGGGLSGDYTLNYAFLNQGRPSTSAGWQPDFSGKNSLNPVWNLPLSIPGAAPGTANVFNQNMGVYNLAGAVMGTNGTTATNGGAGSGGMSSDAGLGGVGGNGAQSGAATNGGNAPGTSYGAGGGGGGGCQASHTTPGSGGNGAGGRIIVIWAE